MTTNSMIVDPLEYLRHEIIGKTIEFANGRAERREPFAPGVTSIPTSGKFLAGRELGLAVAALLEMHLTEGHFTAEFEAKLARWVGARHASFCNSGSSANLLAISALTHKNFPHERGPLQPGDEIITAAAGFPTTLNPIMQNGLSPIFCDVDLGTYVPTMEMIAQALTPRTRAIFMAHTLGNPLPLKDIVNFCRDNKLILIEDNCDALGSLYKGRKTGTFGTLATQSFYPAHHITTGEGGMVLSANGRIKKIVESFRDWGRDCWCAPGEENTCNKRFEWNFLGLPYGYDHKYVYSAVGYNLKSTDLQAALGLGQVDRLDDFVAARRANFNRLHARLKSLGDFFILPFPTVASQPSWFGFPLTLREKVPFKREDLTRFLTRRKIGTRVLFGGNLIRQPAYHDRIAGSAMPYVMHNADKIARDTFWVGVWPGLDPAMLDFVVDSIHQFVRMTDRARSTKNAQNA